MLMTLDNIGGGVVSRSIVSVQVRGVNVYTVMSQSVAAGATLASHVFAVGLAHHSETVAGLSDLREMSLPSMTFDGGDEAIDGMIIVSNPGGAAILQVTSVVLDRLQYLARRDDGGARARARRGRAGEIK